MQGPLPKGSFAAKGYNGGNRWERCMIRGQKYRIVQPFDTCKPGDEWFFVGSYYVPYDDNLSVFVADDEWKEWHIQMHWNEIADNFKEFITPSY